MKNQETLKLTSEELDFIKNGSAEYTKIKVSLGELELQKQGLIKHAESIIEAFTANEKILIEKYGVDSVINMQTGEVTQKEK
jgi:hypothetical protein